MTLHENDRRSDSTLKTLLDRQEILDCLHRYTRGVDRHDDALIASAYHPDAIDDHGAYIGAIPGLIDHVNSSHESFDSHQHHMTNHVVEITGDEAHSETYMVCFFRHRDSETVDAVGGRYIDRLERRDGEWRISERVVVVEWRGGLAESFASSPRRVHRRPSGRARHLLRSPLPRTSRSSIFVARDPSLWSVGARARVPALRSRAIRRVAGRARGVGAPARTGHESAALLRAPPATAEDGPRRQARARAPHPPSPGSPRRRRGRSSRTSRERP